MYKAVVAAIFLIGVSAFSEVKPAELFTNFSMLQRNEPVNIWGTADPGEKVTVEFAGQAKTAEANERGEWLVTLDPMPASSEPQKMVFSSSIKNQQSEIGNVLVGEVWFAGGQSNMQTTMGYYKKKTQPDIDSANDPLLRLVTIPTKFYESHNNKKPQWKDSNPDTVRAFSATAYYFAKNLREALGVPVGIISCAIGGTPAEAWMSREVLENHPELKPTLEGYEAAYHKAFANEAAYLQYAEDFVKESTQWYRDRNAGKEVGPKPRPKMGPRHFKRPSGLYENMFLSVVPYTIRGVIWYQGESDAMFAGDYPEMIKDLIVSWREAWGYGFPFLCVQLAPYGAVLWDNSGESWAWQREAQMAALDLPKTEIAVITDVGEFKDIHPQNKQPVGERLALLAASLDDPSIVARSPVMQSVRFQKGKAYVTFSNVADGLDVRHVSMNRNARIQPGEDPDAFVVPADSLRGFEICGKDRKFKRAQAVLSGPDTVCVWSDDVSSPVAVRYSWANFPLCNLYNSVGLPASPFRTDSFEMPDFYALCDFSESDFEIKDPKRLIGNQFDESLSGWRKSSPDLQTEQLDDWLGIYLPTGKNESLLSSGQVDSGNRFHMQTDLKVLSPRVWGGVVFNYTSPDDYYVFRFCSGTDQAQFIHYIRKSPRVLQSFKASKPFAANTVYRMEVFARPNNPYGDGAYLFKVTDPAAQKTLLRGARIDFGGGMPGGAVGCYIGTPSTSSFFTYKHFVFDVE